LIAGERVDPVAAGQIDGVLATCDPQQCTETSAYPGVRPTGVDTSPTDAVDHTSVALVARSLAVSRDDGSTWLPGTLPAGNTPVAVAMDPNYALSSRMIVGTDLVSPLRSQLLLTSDGGRSFSEIQTAGLPTTFVISALSYLPDGHLLLGMVPPPGGGYPGVRCSSDEGVSWQQTCT